MRYCKKRLRQKIAHSNRLSRKRHQRNSRVSLYGVGPKLYSVKIAPNALRPTRHGASALTPHFTYANSPRKPNSSRRIGTLFSNQAALANIPVCSHKDTLERVLMEHTERITRRQLLGLSAVAAGSLLIPSIAYGSAGSEDSPSPQKNGPICHATLLDKDGNLIASTEKDSFARSASGNFKLEDSLQTKINSDGTITDTYAVEVFEISNARQGSFDRTPIYYIEYDATYYIMDGNIRITSVKGTATKSVSYASFQGSKAVVAHQGIAGSAKCHAEALFTSDSKTLVTGFDAIPYVKSSDSNGYVRNGGECTACLYVSGMGEMILRAEYLI